MKKFLAAAFLAILLAPAMGGNAFSQTSPTTCPTNYTCSLLVTGTYPLVGLPTDGRPSALIGFLNFNASSSITGVISINENGTTDTNYALTGATCTSGSATSLGSLQLTLTTAAGPRTLVYDFVTHASSGGTDLQLSSETTTSPPDTPVSVGTCRESFAP